MKKYLPLILLNLVFTGRAAAQNFFYPDWNRPPLLWQKCLGGAEDDVANALLLTPDGGMIVAGNSKSNDGDVTGHHGTTAFTDGWVVKLSASHEIQWQVSLGGSADDQLSQLIHTTDGGYLCIGTTKSTDGDITNNHGGPDVWLVRLSESGAIIWSKTYGGTRADEGVSVIQLSGSPVKYVLSATTASIDGDVHAADSSVDTNGWIVELDNDGNIIWETSIDQGGLYANKNNAAIGVIELATGKLLACITGYGTRDTSFVNYNYLTESYDTTRFNTNTTPGLLYKLSANDGAAEYFTQTLGAGNLAMGFDGSNISLSYNADGIFYYTCYNNNSNGVPDYNTYPNRVISLLDPVTGLFTNSFLTFNSYYCPDWEPSGENVHFNQSSNGVATVPGDSWVISGQRSTSSRGGTFTNDAYIIGRSFSGNYGGLFVDGFNVIKALPSGNEFVCAGYTNSTEFAQESSDVSGLHGAPPGAYGNFKYDYWVTKISLNPNRLFGKVFLDLNNNNLPDAGEPVYKKAVVKIKKYGNETAAGIGENGYYETVADTGTYVITLSLYDSVHFIASPVTRSITFTVQNSSDSLNFAVHMIGSLRDYSAVLSAPGTARPGFPITYNITCGNNGTDTFINRQILFVKDSRLTIRSPNPQGAIVSGDTVSWQSVNIIPGETKQLSVSMTVPPSPAVNIGDSLFSYAFIDSTGDHSTLDNYSGFKQIVRGGYDPNDKNESHEGSISRLELQKGHYLTYTINFQNTGNDTAFNVVIRDSLDPRLLPGNFEMVGSSHPYSFTIKNGRYISWKMQHINLVDSIHNEPASHGYITYRVKPANNLAVGDRINNKAAIYFDFNQPVNTNTTITTVRRTVAVWTGKVNTDWENKENWSINEVPDGETAVIIPATVPHSPEVNSNAVCFSIQADAAATITVNAGYNLLINGK